MKHRLTFLSVLLIATMSITSWATPDEGMWLPNLIKKLNYKQMQALGCKLTAEEIYSINNSSVKDAIMQLGGPDGGYCTGEIVSEKGLMLTNHHCGYTSIAELSSVEHDYLTDGFWAMSTSEELAVEGLQVARVVRIEDVTSKILADVTDDMEESERTGKIKEAKKALQKETEKNEEKNNFEVRIRSMFNGSEYYMFVYEVFKDVRLVGAPPSSIGKFGGDTDNWMWPRHTGDFSMFRVYMKPDGSASDGYAEENVPYSPKHYLPVSLKGIQKDDFTFIMGFPGTTDRYITSHGMSYKMNTFNPVIVRMLDVRLAKMKEDMDASDEIRIALADNYASLANAHKNFQGEAENLRKTTVIKDRVAYEAEFMKWVNADAKRKEKYGNVLSTMDDNYKKLAPVAKIMLYTSFGLLQASSVGMNTMQFGGLKTALEENESMVNGEVEKLKGMVDKFFEEYYAKTDKKVFEAMLKLYNTDIDKDKRAKYFNETILGYKGKTAEEKIENFVKDVYEESIFTSKERMLAFLEKPKLKTLENDLMLNLFQSIYGELQGGLQADYMKYQGEIDVNSRLLVQGLREFKSNESFYPNANSTLRLTYGTVKSYDPRDGVHYKCMTYIDGIIEKMDNSDPEFIVPDKLVELYEKKDYGQYADSTGNLPIAFLSNNDITGGNSGSPIMNANGELIGLAFDGNYEWLTSNLVYSEELQRCINVDIRYVLWVVDKFAGASHLVEEMKVVK